MNSPIRLVIADDHALFRDGLKSLLRRQRDIQVVGEADTAAALTTAVAATKCDLLLLDLQMERWALDDIPQLASRTKVVVLTANENMENAIAAMRLGARAVVQKRFAFHTLVAAIRTVAHGFVWMPPALQAAVASQWTSSASKSLTSREIEIVRQVASGLRNAEVAQQLALAEATVKSHLSNIFYKLKVRDRVELTVYAIKNGLISAENGRGPSRGSP
jgi:DNA-binding NarL/FixJ family response regulator